jgi:DNA-binding transcriptional ArsR family regulator
MANPKQQPLSPEVLQLVAGRFRMLGDPMRLRLLQCLQSGEQSVGALTEAVETTQPNVSKHLKLMQDANLVARRQEGNTVYYSIADPLVFELCELVCNSLQQQLTASANLFGKVKRRKG